MDVECYRQIKPFPNNMQIESHEIQYDKSMTKKICVEINNLVCFKNNYFYTAASCLFSFYQLKIL